MRLEIPPNYIPEQLSEPIVVYKVYYQFGDIHRLCSIWQGYILNFEVGKEIVSNRENTTIPKWDIVDCLIGKGFHVYTDLKDAEGEWTKDRAIVAFWGKPEHFVAEGKWYHTPCMVFTKLTCKEVIKSITNNSP